MNNLIKIISTISISLVSIFTLTGCDLETLQNNIAELNSGNEINLKEGCKFIDIKIGVYNRSTYVYVLTKKRETFEKPETYNLDLVLNTGYHVSMPKHITVIEN